MPSKRSLLLESEAESLRLESAVWIEVLQTLRGSAQRESGWKTHPAFLELADKALAALEASAAMACAPDEPLVVEARQRLQDALGAASKYDDLIDSMFYIRFATRSVESLVAEAEETDAHELSPKEREELKESLADVVGELERSLAELREQLAPPQPSNSNRSDAARRRNAQA